MRILFRQFLGKNHSWSCVGWGLTVAAKQLGHQVELFSTDGIEFLPESLKENLIGYTEENSSNIIGRLPDSNYDCQISYTSMKNFPHYLNNARTKIGIWCYEWAGKNVLPTGFAKYHKNCDILCAPSNFAKQVFLDSGVPDAKIAVIPHGINSKEYQNTSTIKIKTNKSYKILANIAQNHMRKNIPGLLETYGKAFTKKDDVVLVLKAKEKPVKFPFDVSLKECLNNFHTKFPNHGEVVVIDYFIEDMSALYRSVDTAFSIPYCEAFQFPMLEILAAGKLAITSKWGGQLDFLDKNNSLLVDGKEERADPRSMYWSNHNNAIWFRPSIDDAVDKLKYAYKNYERLNAEINKNRQIIYDRYDWTTIMKEFLALCR